VVETVTVKKDTRQRILKAAFELFTSSSYDKVSIGDIVKKAGVSKGGLFHYFDSKYDLARQAIIGTVEEMWREPIKELETVKDPHKRLKRLIDFSVDMTIRNPKLIKFFIDIHDESLKRGDGDEVWLEFFNNYIEIISQMFEDCGIPNPKIKAMILLVSLDAVGWEASHFPELNRKIDKKMLKNEFFELFVGNYRELSTRGG
jgi:AcrR family transcriptional regulator